MSNKNLRNENWFKDSVNAILNNAVESPIGEEKEANQNASFDQNMVKINFNLKLISDT